MLRRLSMIALLLVAPYWMTGVTEGQTETPIVIAIGEPGSESFVFGTELWALGQLALKPNNRIGMETFEAAEESERLALLRNTEAEVTLIRGQVPTSDNDTLRIVMTLWPEGRPVDTVMPAQLIAHEDVAADVIYRLTKAIYGNTAFFKNARATLGVAPVSQAIAGATLPVHPGAFRFYEEEGFSHKVTTITPASSATTFADFDDAALDHRERSQVAAACRQALELGALSAVLGDMSNRGCEVYQAQLVDQEDRQSREIEIRQDLFALPGGQGGPAIALDDSDSKDPASTTVAPDYPLVKSNPRQPTM